MFTLPHRGRRPGGRTALGALFVALWLTLVAVPASAHDTLVDSVPAADEVLSVAPSELVLTFSGEISDLGVQFMVTGPEGRDVVQGTPTVEGTTVTQALAEELMNGDYEVTWRVTSSDGHPISGTILFAVDAEEAATDGGESTSAPVPTEATEAPSETDGPAETTAAPAPTESTTAPTSEAAESPDTAEATGGAAETDPAESSGGIPTWGWLVAGLAAIGLVACGFLAFRRN